MTKRKWLILAAVVVVAGLFVVLGLNRDTHPQHFTAKVERGDIHDLVEATGTLISPRCFVDHAASQYNLS